MDTEIVRTCCMCLKQDIEKLIQEYKKKVGEGVDLIVNVTTQTITTQAIHEKINITKYKVDTWAQITPQ